MRKILISACLLGETCRYDGKAKHVSDPRILQWERDLRLIPVCPEVLGGLPVPRTPCERKGAKIITADGRDCTPQFEKGAQAALSVAQENNVICCILKENSPSCGSSAIYDGTFSGRKIKGMGVAAELLIDSGFAVFSENELDKAEDRINKFDEDFKSQSNIKKKALQFTAKPFVILLNRDYTTPCAFIASATLRKPAIFAPATRSSPRPYL
ncbi:MAG: DUF523 domain-containing protein [Oscillospiraceae bacterium]